MTKQDKALAVIVATALVVGVAGFVRWRDRRFLDIARSIDACDDEPTVQRRTADLGAPNTDERRPESRLVTWRRNGKVLTVAFVTPPSGRLVVGVVTVAVDRREDAPEPLYEDKSGLRSCR